MTPNTSFELFRHFVQESIQKVGNEFTDPEEDWAHMLLIEAESGITLAGIDPRFFESVEDKQRLVYEIIVPQLKELDAFRYAFVASAWMVGGPKEVMDEAIAMASQTRLSEHPDKVEAVLVTIADREQAEVWSAEINRFEDKPPTLNKWERADKGAVQGLMLDPLVAALREE